MNELKIFESPDFGKMRTLEIDGEPWFVGKDVAVILGYERPTKAVADHVDEEDRDEVPIQDSIGRMQNTPVINESGLYSLIMSSKLPTAKKFKRWVTSEVLPSIRKTGGYAKPMSAMEMIAQIAQHAAETDKRIEQLEQKTDYQTTELVHEALTYSTLDFTQQQRIMLEVQYRALLLNRDEGYSGNARRYMNQMYADLRREFGVISYKDIRKRDFDRAIWFIENWALLNRKERDNNG